ncbi:hypothetical protein B7486_79335 [cyanobacterium TDX16]|nr:hypothetical protein B7486_79335 [cyanobacterium TDX16]
MVRLEVSPGVVVVRRAIVPHSVRQAFSTADGGHLVVVKRNWFLGCCLGFVAADGAPHSCEFVPNTLTPISAIVGACRAAAWRVDIDP